MQNQSKNHRNCGMKATLILGLILALAGCAQKPVLKQVDESATEQPINSPTRAAELVRMHSK